jgi:hypothetical protein
MDKKQKFALFLVILLACYFRFLPNLNWDHGLLLHPDERFLAMVAEKVKLPNSISQYWNSKLNPLSPYNNGYDYYVYGNLPLTLTKVVASTFKMTHYDNIFIIGRALSTIADILTIWGIFLIGALLFNYWTGISAAFLLTVSVQNIQLCRFMGTENFVALGVVFTFYFLLKAWQLKDKSYLYTHLFFILSAITFGFSLASKISAIFFLPICLLGMFWAVFNLNQDYIYKKQFKLVALESYLGLVIIFILITIFALRIGQPSIFDGNSFLLSEIFVDNMKRIKEVTDGGEWPPNVQWAGRTSILFTLKHIFFYEMGPGLGLICAFGICLSVYEILKKKKFETALITIWILFFLLYQSTRFVKYGRYLSIIYPFACLIGGYWLVSVKDHRIKLFRSILIVSTLIWAFSFHSIYWKPHSRVEASRWIYNNIPSGSVIGSEQWDDTLPLRIDGKDGFGGMYTEKSYNFYETDSDKKREEIINHLNSVDYLILTSNRQFATIPRVTKRYPLTAKYYEYLFTNKLGFELVKSVIRKPSFFGIEINTQNAVESFTVYDHPAVYIFKKSKNYSAEYIRDLLNDFPNGEFQPITKAATKEISWLP